MGEYRHGMWMCSLERDLAWKYYGDEATIGRPREGPSWSWVHAADGRIEWPLLLFDDLYRWYHVHGLVENENGLAKPHKDALLLSGILVPVSIQTWTDRESFENAFPLSRYCNVMVYRRRHSQTPLHTILRSRHLLPPLLGHSGSDYEHCIVHEAESEHDETMHGTFTADYRFWASEELLQQQMQHVIFMVMGVDIDSSPPSLYSGGTDCWVAGLLLRPADRRTPEKGIPDRYERIGWLRYSTREERNKYTPLGVRTNFVLV